VFHFAITETDLQRLKAARNDEDVMAIIEAIEEAWSENYLAYPCGKNT
jgi:hypothetical protein